MFSRDGSLLPSSYADVRYIDDVIAIEGHGSFGQVYLMRHKELDVLFAVKQIRDSMNDTERHQLLTDLDIIRESHCPFIVRYHGE